MNKTKKEKFSLDSLLFTIEKEDIEILRINKNKNREFFFEKNEITPEQQEKWFLSFSERSDDFMFVCKEKETTFGCMGFRIFEDKVDAYNIMRFCPSSISMKEVFCKMLEFAASKFPNKTIQVRVLNTNPAISWYKSLGFEEASIETNYVTLYYR